MHAVGHDLADGVGATQPLVLSRAPVVKRGKRDNADLVGRHIEELRKQEKGELTPIDVVNDARNPNSPLHSFFEWDDTTAGEQHRLAQARGLIRAVVAIFREPEKPQREIRAFVHIPEGQTSHYRATEHAMSMEKTRNLVLLQAWREFVSWRKKYKDLSEFADLFAKADALAKEMPKPD